MVTRGKDDFSQGETLPFTAGSDLEERLHEFSRQAMFQATAKGVTPSERDPTLATMDFLMRGPEQRVWEAQALLESFLREQVALHTEKGHLVARSFVRNLLEKTDPGERDNLPLLIELSLFLGWIYLGSGDYPMAPHYEEQARRYFKKVYSLPYCHPSLEGRIFSQTGTVYLGLGQYELALANWRVAEDCLEAARSPDVTIPRDAIAKLRQACSEIGNAALFDTLWQASDKQYHWLRLRRHALQMTPEMQRRSGLSPSE